MKNWSYVVLVGAAVIMYGLQVMWFTMWWGSAGALVGFYVPFLVVVFPFIYLLKEGFSFIYFGLLAIGIIAFFIGDRSEQKGDK